MRIGIFTDTYLPDINGVASSSQILRNELVKHGHEVLVVTTEIKKGVEYEDEPNVYRLSGIELKNLYDYRLASFFSAKAMKTIKAMKLDLIHVQTEFGVGIFGKIAAHILNIPVVYTYHTQYEDYVHYAPVIGKIEPMQPLLKKAVSMLSQIYGDNCTELIAPSVKTKDILKNYGIENEIHVIPTGLELSRFEKENLDLKHLEEVKNECGIHDRVFSLIFLGRIAPEKSIDMVISAIPLLKEKQCPVRLVIVGGGPGLDALSEQAKDLGVADDIYFAGARQASEVPYYYHACDAFVSASVSETQGLTYIEAMAAGLPVLARYDKNLDGIINHGKNGYFFENAEELALLAEKMMHEDRTEMQQQAYQDSRQYSSEVFYEKIMEVYDKAIIDKHFTYKIGNISPRPNQMCEVILKIDNQSIALHLPEKYVLSHQLEVGQVIEHEAFEDMQTYEFVFKGYKKALKLLTGKDYTRKQMTEKLKKTGEYDDEHINIIISLLEERQLINDEMYAEDYMRRSSRMGLGIRKALMKLKDKGINEEILEHVRENYSRELEVEKATELVRKIYRSNKTKSKSALLHAIRDKLFYNGYEPDVINEAMDNVPYEVSADFERQLLDRELGKAEKKYQHKYEGKELENKIFIYLSRKGFEYDLIKEALEERSHQFDQNN